MCCVIIVSDVSTHVYAVCAFDPRRSAVLHVWCGQTGLAQLAQGHGQKQPQHDHGGTRHDRNHTRHDVC